MHRRGEVFNFFSTVGTLVKWAQAGASQVVDCLLKGT